MAIIVTEINTVDGLSWSSRSGAFPLKGLEDKASELVNLLKSCVYPNPDTKVSSLLLKNPTCRNGKTVVHEYKSAVYFNPQHIVSFSVQVVP